MSGYWGGLVLVVASGGLTTFAGACGGFTGSSDSPSVDGPDGSAALADGGDSDGVIADAGPDAPRSDAAGMWACPSSSPCNHIVVTTRAYTGGVVGVNGIGLFLGANDNRTETYVRHLDHMVQLVGPAHVAIALDYVFDASELDEYLAKNPQLFPASEGYAAGLRMVAPEQLPEVCDALVRLGYSDDDLALILGGSLLRVAEQVWRAA